MKIVLENIAEDCELQKIDLNPIIFIPDITDCECISVYDGDTITVKATPKQFKTDLAYDYKWKVRLLGINAPEIRGKEPGALEARDALSNLILGKNIKLDIKKYGKYGRLVANVYLDDLLVNDYMISHGFADVYIC
jgi:micrococcal nuclease